MVGHDALGLSLAFAVALAAFLELALISSALLARASAMAGRPAVADAVAVWVFSAVSGLFSASANLSGIVTPLVIGAILQATGSFYGALAFVGGVALAGAVSWIFLIGDIRPIEI